ncbi:hypothetical protein DSCO28_60090 [Desulfosarcina ovata subsp. sediminis]|uniref:TolC family protein n=1 Tax=Desulfosarcina ovata subsp. sediminis TaxID=885957 RepID=A0A5K7ZYU6_9BACT|nr:TolC family protein [Desulfosarcina ovata]BBO85443.1 hypothetical protein DSCO28_60090 [Desulfosarcina ovata subsp. sediminis]
MKFDIKFRPYISLVLFVLMGVLFLAGTRPAVALTLEDLMDSAMNNRALIKAYAAMLEKSEKEVTRTRGRFFPSIDFGYEYNHLDETGLSETDRDFGETSVSATWNLFAGFKDISDLNSAKKQRDINRYFLGGIQQDIRLDVALGFLGVFGAMADLEVAEDALSLYRTENRNVRLKYDVGLLKKNDWLKIKVEMDNALQEVHSSRARLAQEINNLSLKTVTRFNERDLVFDRFDRIPDLDDKTRCRMLLMENRSEIKALRARVEDYAARINSAKAGFYPKLNLISEYRCRDDSPNDSHFGDESRLQLQVSMNLFDGLQKNMALGKARLDVEKARFDLTELERQMNTRLDNLFLEFEVSLKNMEVARKSRIEAGENLRVTRLAFEKGMLTSADLLDSIYYLSRARFKLVDSRITLFRNHFHILRMIEAL